MEEVPGAIYSGAIVLQEIVLERVSWQQKSKDEAGGGWGGWDIQGCTLSEDQIKEKKLS